MTGFRNSTALLAAALALSACATVPDGDYPSLERRAAERLTGSALPAEGADSPPPAPPLSADLETQVARLLRQARNAHGDFERMRGPTGAMVSAARGTARASESWISAQVALADLQSARSGAMVALAELDELYVKERLGYSQSVSPSAALIGEARDTVEILVSEEDLVIDRLAGMLR
ncbi:MAG: hypothetical protein R3D89_04220 [Sphingomonadaceae bacterium]